MNDTRNTFAARACRRIRQHPITVSYVISCAAFAAGVIGTVASLITLGAILGAEVALVAHLVGHVRHPHRSANREGPPT